MELYTRQQLMLVLSLLAAAGVGLGVSHWRAAHPQLVERLERLDREIAASDAANAEDRSVARTTTETRPPQKHQALPLSEPGSPLDLNRASQVDLMRLPGIGPVLARRILETRETVGRFGAVEDLGAVRGLGKAKLERLRPFVSVLE